MSRPSNCVSKKLEQDFARQLNRELSTEEKALLQWMEQQTYAGIRRSRVS